MGKQRQYWVVSPNVMFRENTVADWKKEILRTHAAIMGYDSRHNTGRRFGNDVQPGDIILIARRHSWKPDVVGVGVVIGKLKKQRFPMSNRPVYMRELNPFIPVEQKPEDIPFLNILNDTKALRQLYPNPEKKDPAWQVCQWMERQLGLEEQKGDVDATTERGLPKSKTYDYKVRTREQVREARKREKELLDDYKQWLKKQGRHLSVLPYGRLECDAWEKERQNLIEAKGSISREDIRMAVGQLFDYSFQGKEKYKQPNMAILLPRKPSPERIEWLEPLGIKIVWRNRQSFVDNAGGQFI